MGRPKKAARHHTQGHSRNQLSRSRARRAHIARGISSQWQSPSGERIPHLRGAAGVGVISLKTKIKILWVGGCKSKTQKPKTDRSTQTEMQNVCKLSPRSMQLPGE